MALNASDAFSSALSLFSSLYEDMNPTDLPEGLSPDNQDVWFLPGSVSTRPALSRYLTAGISGSPQILSLADLPLPTGEHVAVLLDANGVMSQRNPDGSTAALLTTNAPGGQFKSCSAFTKQFYAFYDATLAAEFSDSPFVGTDIPRYYDGQNMWRVTQDAPGAPPTISTLKVPSVAVQGTGSPITTNIVASPNGIVWGGLTYTTINGQAGFYYTYFTVTTSAAHGLAAGNLVTLSATSSTPGFNGARLTVASVPSTTTFTVAIATLQGTQANGGGGTVTLVASSAALSRSANIVLAVTASAHNFQPGWQVSITGVTPNALGGTISSISRDANGIVTVVTATAHGLEAGNSFIIFGVSNPDASFNGQFTVATVVSSTSFTYEQAGLTAESSSAGTGQVLDSWTGDFVILSTPTSTTFTYFQLGPNDSTVNTGVATIVPLMAAGPRSAVLIFKGANGALTAPSIPVIFDGDGTNLLLVNNILIGPPGTTQRILAFTPAFGENFYYLSPAIVPASGGTAPLFQNGTIINDNTTTSAVIDFSDTSLTAGTQIDIAGNNLFNQVVLAPCLGVIEYQGRLAWWGEINNLKNLTNPGFDGGFIPVSYQAVPGSGANSGSGTAWTNPGNISSASSYADANVPTNGTSQALKAETFGLSTNGTPKNAVMAFQFYWTGNPFGALAKISVQLLKAGTPFGSPINFALGSGNQASSGDPVGAAANFPLTGLTAADLNASTWGFQFTVVGGSAGAHVFLRGASVFINADSGIPPGWSIAGSSGGTTALVGTDVQGFSLAMTSAGGTQDCLISQPVYEDYYGAPILENGRQYIARLLIQATGLVGPTPGNLIVAITSQSTGLNSQAVFPMANVGSGFDWYTMAFPALPAVVPPDAVLSVFLQNVTSGAIVTIDELETVDALQPVLGQQLRVSYFNNEFGYDEETGLIGADTSAAITACFKQRGVLYMLTDQSRGSMFRTQDNGSTEPDGWEVDEFAQDVDCAGPNAVDNGEGVAWWAGQSGLRIFAGDQPKKLSQERQATWNRINWNATLALWVKNDPIQRILYVGTPLDANTAVNQVQPMSYRSVNSALEPADPLHISYSGKLICSDLCRKWTRWNFPANCAEMLTEGNAAEIVFGAGNGQLYSLDFDKFTDDDYGVISSYYTTYFHWNHEMEQSIPQLGLHRKIYAYLSAFITGVGNLTITPLVDALDNPWQPLASVWNPTTQLWEPGAAIPAVSEALTESLTHDQDFPLNVTGDRVAFQIAVTPLAGQTDAYFNLQHLVVSGRMDRILPVRGSYL